MINKLDIDLNKSNDSVARHISLVGGASLVLLVVLLNFLNTKTSGWSNWALILVGVLALTAISSYLLLSFSDVGLSKKYFKSGLIYGAISALIIFTVLGIAYLVNSELFIDSRYNNELKDILYLVFVFIPLHTIFIEELLFRGTILGYLLRVSSERSAIIGSSAIFGLWHILPSLGISASSQTISNTIGSDYTAQVLSIVGVVLATFIAGIVFCWLRIRSNSLVAPVIAHWAINATALVLASLAN